MFKKTLIAAAVLLTLLTIAAIALISSFDPNDYKDDLTTIVREKQQRTLKIDGDIKLSYFPKLGIKLGKTSLSERASEQPFASINEAHLALAVMPLLRKELVIDEIRLDGVSAVLTRDKSGKTNVDDLITPEKDAKDKPSDDQGQVVKLDIAGFMLEDSNLELRDSQGGMQVSLKNVALRTGRIAPGVPIELDLRADVDAREPRVAGKVALKGGLTFDAKAGRYAISKFDANINGSGFGIRDGKLSLKGNALLDLSGQRIETDGLSLEASGMRGSAPFELELDAPRLAISPQSASGSAIKGSAKLSGAQSADVKFNATGVSGNAQSFSIAKLTLDFKLKQGARDLSGTFSSPLRGNINGRSFELPTIAADITINDPAMTQKTVRLPISGSARADLTKQNVSANIATRFDESNIRGKLGMTRFNAPALTFDVDVDQLNVDRYIPVAPKGDAAPPASKSASAAAEKPIDLSALKTLNATGEVRLGALQVKGVKANKIVVAVRAAGGRLDIPVMSANLYQGTLNGSASVSATNQYAFKQTLSNVAINPLMKDAVNRDLLEGRGNIGMNLTSNGSTVGAIKRALDGSASMSLRDGAVKGINLAQTLRDVKSKIGMANQTQTADKGAKTDFSELSATFAVRNGVASNNDLSLKSPFIRVGGAGTIDVGQGSMDYLAKATVVNTSTGQDGKDLRQLKDLAIPVRIVGPFERLSYEVQRLAISSDALKATVKDKLQEKLLESLGGRRPATSTPAQQGAPAQTSEDKLKNQLKGLFGR